MSDYVWRDVKWDNSSKSLSQVPSEGLEYAWLSNKNEQLHQFVLCKDFMQDTLFGYLNKCRVSIYGFEYDPEKDPKPALAKSRLLLTNFKDEQFGEKLEKNCLPLLHAIEDRLKIPRSYLERCNDPPAKYKKSGVWILIGSRRWLKAPPMVSLYTLLIRVGMVHNPADTPEQTFDKIISGATPAYYDGYREKGAVKSALKGIKFIMQRTDRKIFPHQMRENYPLNYKTAEGKEGQKLSVSTMHNNCGIVAFTNGQPAPYFPKWAKVEG